MNNFLYNCGFNSLKIEDIQNISLFTIAISSLFLYLNYNLSSLWSETNLTNTITQYDALIPFVGLHAFIDIFLTKTNDLRLHHLFILGILFYNNYYDVSAEDRFIFSYPLLKTELSSIFYVLKYWLPKKSIFYTINTALFYFSFAKFRIYDFYNDLIYNNLSFNIIYEKYSQLHSHYGMPLILLISLYGLYILNMYWFLIMNKILYKTIRKVVNNLDTDILCHKLCSYLQYVNLLISLYIYGNNPNEKYIIDMIGLCNLSISSYIYHNNIYEKLRDKEIEEHKIPNQGNIILFLNDALSIQLRSFFVVFTNYYGTPNYLPFIIISVVLHLNGAYQYNINTVKLLIDYDNKKDTFMINHYINIAIPIIYDVFLVAINSPIEIAIPFLLVNVMIGFLFAIEPFYRLTHVGFHILLIAQNYYICLGNCSANPSFY